MKYENLAISEKFCISQIFGMCLGNWNSAGFLRYFADFELILVFVVNLGKLLKISCFFESLSCFCRNIAFVLITMSEALFALGAKTQPFAM